MTSTARSGVAAGMGISVAQMVLATLGVVDPMTSSVLQEVVDLARFFLPRPYYAWTAVQGSKYTYNIYITL